MFLWQRERVGLTLQLVSDKLVKNLLFKLSSVG